MSKLLFDERPLVVDTILAKLLGLNEAIVLQQVNYWLHSSQNYRDGRKWVYNTYKQWQEQFPFWSEVTIRRIFTGLEKKGILLTANYNEMKADHTKWYSIDHEKLEGMIRPCDQNDQPLCSNRSHPSDQNEQSNTRDYTEITTEIEEEEEKAPRPDPFIVYQQEIGVASPLIIEDISKWIDEGHFDEPHEIICEAIKAAVFSGVTKWKYVNAILNDWVKRKVKTLAQAKAAMVEFENKQKLAEQKRGAYNGKRVQTEDKLPDGVQKQLEKQKAGEFDSGTPKRISDDPELAAMLNNLRRPILDQ
ncbi:DnaD domain protein [Brevibacillus nitrificans]|uniref:DnaD domain-containing protein n=1 Tax=Brevibacillus nitrificans TaxID=651560 RepID=UPI0028584C27|nr:DnaD domain protein [Brevibacillus nitrificans]MDR7318885.1 DnaD/phage-associated family protein [Brevibacillus nitrificans]